VLLLPQTMIMGRSIYSFISILITVS